jgi:ankyrin repeat protein
MKYCLFFLIIFYGTSFNKVNYAEKSDEPLIPVNFSSQQDPFYFLIPVPVAVKLFDKIDLSFFRNKLIVFQYRYRIQAPYGGETAIDGRLIIWSAWIRDDLTDIKIPRLNQEGGYKLIVEYKTQKSTETKKFERVFYVYHVNPLANTEKTAKTMPATNKTTTNITAETTANKTAKTAANAIPSTNNATSGKMRVNDKRMDLKDVKLKVNITPITIFQTANTTAEPSKQSVAIEKSIPTDIDILLAEAIEKKDTITFSELILNSTGTNLKGKNGGNIFHLINDDFSSENLISMLKNMGFSINETDNNGYSPLHLAILLGENRYARSLINQGADLNIKSNTELSPLHLAVLLNNEEIVRDLLIKGAEVNLKGNTGYTPLHIASEMNYIEIAKNLLFKGATNGIKTNQGLSPKTIAKIQNNNEMMRLIRKKDSGTLNPPKSSSIISITNSNSDKQNPKIDFNLPYDKELAKKRQFCKFVQFISVPVFALSAVGMTYLKSEASNYYSLSKIAETENIAKAYYKKAGKYDTNSYISGGISLVSVYGFIHSTIRKKNISNKMYKTFNYALLNY